MTIWTTCWFWQADCEIDYAAWAQAVGTVVAILFAWLVGHKQTRSAERENKEKLSLYVSYLNESVKDLISNTRNRDTTKSLGAIRILEELQQYGRTVQLEKLPFSARVGLLRINGYVHDILAVQNFGFQSNFHSTSAAYMKIHQELEIESMVLYSQFRKYGLSWFRRPKFHMENKLKDGMFRIVKAIVKR